MKFQIGKNQIEKSNNITVLDVEVNGASKLLKKDKERRKAILEVQERILQQKNKR